MKSMLIVTLLAAAAAFVSFGAQARDDANIDPWSPDALAERARGATFRSDIRGSVDAGYRDEWSPSALHARFAGTSVREATQGRPGPGYHDEWSPAALAGRFRGGDPTSAR